jgi:hypothetical protein
MTLPLDDLREHVRSALGPDVLVVDDGSLRPRRRR